MDDNNRHTTNNNELATTREEKLLAAEANAVSSFLKVVNNVIRGDESENPMSEKTALKFLISRKFDIQRALHLYQLHEVTRLRERLTTIDPNDSNLKAELDSGKFTLLKNRDSNNSAIAVFTARLHAPNKSSKNQILRRKIHRNTLQGIVYQLDCALEDIITQRNGLVFIYNMSDSDYSNFDYDLCQKILNLLKGAYPAKLKKVLIVSPPLWFRAPFHLLRLIVREKLRDRVWLLKTEQLLEHVPPYALTLELGGNYQHDHQAWINECNNLYKTRLNDLCDPSSAQTLIKSFNSKSNSNFRQSSYDISSEFSLDSIAHDNVAKKCKSGKKQSKASMYDYDDRGLALNQFIEYIKGKGKRGLSDEYEEIVTHEKTGTFLVSSSPMNMRKNRYVNVKCYDHSRVVLEPYDLIDGIDINDTKDYINASFVDGYRQSKAYISTQGPVEWTFVDFWRMIWQTGCRVIVMVTLNIENEMTKCDKYWPGSAERVMRAGVYTIEHINSERHEDFIVTHLKLTNTRSEVSRDIWHFQFISWPDFGTPATATALLKYRESVLKKQLDAIELTGGSTYPPIVVHCSAGVGRSGTFITIDVCIQKLETTGLVDVKSVVEKLRQQRYSSIQTKDQYTFCYKSIVEYAASCGMLTGEDIKNLL